MQLYNTGVIVLNFNNSDGTLVALRSFCLHHSYEKIAIVVVDNNSNDNPSSILAEFCEELGITYCEVEESEISRRIIQCQCTLIRLSANYGYARGNNFGVRLLQDSNVDNLLIINNDIIFTEAIVDDLIDSIADSKAIAISSVLLRKIDGSIDYNCARRRLTHLDILITSTPLSRIGVFKKILQKRYILKGVSDAPSRLEVDLPSGSCMMVKSSVFRLIGNFDENTFLWYEEDILFEKIRNLGLKNLVLCSCSAIHIGAESTKKSRLNFTLKANIDSLCYYLVAYRSYPEIVAKAIYAKEWVYIRLIEFRHWLYPDRFR